MRFGWARALGLSVAVLGLAACGGDGAGSSSDPAANLAQAQAFMQENATAEGVQTLPGGVQVKVVRSGPAGGASPDANDLVSVHYEGTLTDGTVFDSSFERGVPYATHLDQVVPGWTIALSRMKPGDEWLLYIPPEQGYGEQSSGPIPPNSVLVFRVQLLDVAPVPGSPRPQPGLVGQV